MTARVTEMMPMPLGFYFLVVDSSGPADCAERFEYIYIYIYIYIPESSGSPRSGRCIFESPRRELGGGSPREGGREPCGARRAARSWSFWRPWGIPRCPSWLFWPSSSRAFFRFAFAKPPGGHFPRFGVRFGRLSGAFWSSFSGSVALVVSLTPLTRKPTF